MSRIKECFISRWDKGLLVQFDYSQLEVICLAFLSGDEVLRDDLLSGTDMHCRAGSFLSGRDYTELKHAYDAGNEDAAKIRRQGKTLAFLVQYGGSGGLMHKQTGIPKKDCTHFIKEYYARYRGVKLWQDDVAQKIVKARKASTHMVGEVQAGSAKITSISGRIYTFVEQIAPAWVMTATSFSPTQMKNFLIQGFATGDVVPMMLGRTNRFLKEHWNPELVLMVNTTHDSIMLDVHPTVDAVRLVTEVIEQLEQAPAILEDIFDIKFDMPLKVTAEWGSSWGKLTPC